MSIRAHEINTVMYDGDKTDPYQVTLYITGKGEEDASIKFTLAQAKTLVKTLEEDLALFCAGDKFGGKTAVTSSIFPVIPLDFSRVNVTRILECLREGTLDIQTLPGLTHNPGKEVNLD